MNQAPDPNHRSDPSQLYTDKQLKEMRNFRHRLEGSFRYDFHKARDFYMKATVGVGVAAGLTMVVMYCYNAGVYGPDVPGYIFAMNLGTWVVTGLLQLLSHTLRKHALVKHGVSVRINKNGENKGDPLLLTATVECLFGYYAAAAALALGYYCTTVIVGGALTLELAAIGGAITGAVIAFPSAFIGPSGEMQGHTPHTVGLVSSAIAGSASFITAKIVSDMFFTHLGIALDTLKPDLACLMHITVALPVYATVQILISSLYEGILSVAGPQPSRV